MDNVNNFEIIKFSDCCDEEGIKGKAMGIMLNVDLTL